MRHISQSFGVMLLLAGCINPGPPAQIRRPTQPKFLVRGAYSGSNGGGGVVYLDSERGLARLDLAERSFLVPLAGKRFTVLYPRSKKYFVYDPARQEALEKEHRLADKNRYARAALDSGGGGVSAEMECLLAHPCERAKVRLRQHSGCEHSDSADGTQLWKHTRTDVGGLQEGFKERVTTLSNEYEPRRGLILAENYDSSFGSGSTSFHPEPESVKTSDFEVPAGYLETLTESQLKAEVLPTVGQADMPPGATWELLDYQQDNYPTGELKSRALMTSELWARGGGGSQGQVVRIWRLKVLANQDLRKPGLLRDLNVEYRLCDRFVDPKSDPPGSAPFLVGKEGWALVRAHQAVHVGGQPGSSSQSTRALLDWLAPRI